MFAEIIAVGSEMLTPQRIDTNSLYLTAELNGLGVEVASKCVIGDDRARLAEAISIASERSRIVIISGGLGPTEDDVTRDATAEALGRTQSFRQEVCDAIEERFRRFNRRMAEVNKRQAFIIDGAEILPNDRGTAPGQWIDTGQSVIVLLPGPPHELKAMFERECRPRLERLLPPQVICTRVFRVCGIGESDLDQLIAPAYTKYGNPATTILAAPNDIHVYLRARCSVETEAVALLDELGSQIEALLGDRIYSRNGDPLETEIGTLLRACEATLSVAESCTGGLLASHITAVPGSSDYFLGGYLTYTNRMKTEMLGIDPDLIALHTDVSEAVAKAMAQGARHRSGSTYALSTTGIAGPTGGTEDTPVGTVYIGIAGPGGCAAKRFQYPGDRERVRLMAVQSALDLLRRRLL
jgi:nicotinamide-nucleotide amidase